MFPGGEPGDGSPGAGRAFGWGQGRKDDMSSSYDTQRPVLGRVSQMTRCKELTAAVGPRLYEYILYTLWETFCEGDMLPVLQRLSPYSFRKRMAENSGRKDATNLRILLLKADTEKEVGL